MSNHDPLASNGHTQLTPISVLPNTNTADELRDARRELTLLRRQLARAEEGHKKDVARLQEHLNEQIHLTEVDLKEARKERDELLMRGSRSPIAEIEREKERVKKEEAEKLSREEEKKGLENTVENLTARVSELERERDAERGRAAMLDRLTQELKTTSEKLSSENSQLVKINGELVDQVETLKNERRGLRDERDMAKATLDVVQAQHDGSMADRDELTRERDDLRIERDDLRAERDELFVIRDELTAERDTLLEERQIRETLQAVSPSTSVERASSPTAGQNPQQDSTPPIMNATQPRVKIEPETSQIPSSMPPASSHEFPPRPASSQTSAGPMQNSTYPGPSPRKRKRTQHTDRKEDSLKRHFVPARLEKHQTLTSGAMHIDSYSQASQQSLQPQGQPQTQAYGQPLTQSHSLNSIQTEALSEQPTQALSQQGSHSQVLGEEQSQAQYPPASPPPYAPEEPGSISVSITPNQYDQSITVKPDLESRLADANSEEDMVISPIISTREDIVQVAGRDEETDIDFVRRVTREERAGQRGRSLSRSRGNDRQSPRPSPSKRDLQSRLTSRTPSPANRNNGNRTYRRPPSRTPSPGPRHLHRLPTTRDVSPYERGRTREFDRGGRGHQPPTAPLSWRRSPPHPPPTQPAAFYARDRERERGRDRERDVSPTSRPSQYALPPPAHDLPPHPNTHRLPPPSLPAPPLHPQGYIPTSPSTTKGYGGAVGGGGYGPRGPASYAPSTYSRGRSKSMSRSRSPSRSGSRSRSEERRFWEREAERNRDGQLRERDRMRERSRALGFEPGMRYDDGDGYYAGTEAPTAWNGYRRGPAGDWGREDNNWRPRY